MLGAECSGHRLSDGSGLACGQSEARGCTRVNQGRENEVTAGWASWVLGRTPASTLSEVGAMAGF